MKDLLGFYTRTHDFQNKIWQSTAKFILKSIIMLSFLIVGPQGVEGQCPEYDLKVKLILNGTCGYTNLQGRSRINLY